jgi:hypothetical protein
MAESQSRYGIIEELTEKLNEERGRIATLKSVISKQKSVGESMKRDKDETVLRMARAFEQKWEDEKKRASELEKRMVDDKRILDRGTEQAENEFNYNHAKWQSDSAVTIENSNYEIKASEEKIAEIKSSIEALKLVSKESAKQKEQTAK